MSYTGTVKLIHRLKLLFLPHEKNNHRAFLLQPSFLAILMAVYLLNQSIIKSIGTLKPGVLGYSSEITVSKVLKATNLERLKYNLPELKYNETLSKSATAKAKDMFANNYWAHTSPTGKTPWDFFKENDYQYSVAGENLAKDFYDTESLMRAWMNSPTHKANIVNSKYQEIGLGVVNGVLDGVETTLVVQHFGTPLNRAAASAPNPVEPVTQTEKVPVAVSPDTPQVLASTNTTINPLFLSKIIGGFMFALILILLIIDAIYTLRHKTYRVAGSSAGHISFLAIVFLLLLFSQQGKIF